MKLKLKDMLKSKFIIGFVVLMLGIVFIDSSITARLERQEDSKNAVVALVDIR